MSDGVNDGPDIWAGRSDGSDSGDGSNGSGPDIWEGRSDDSGHAGPRIPSAQLIARILLAVILIGGPALGIWVALDLLSVRGSLQEARSALGDVRGSLGDVDVVAASEALEVAEQEMADAQRRSGRWSWSVAAVVPVVGPTVDVTREVVEVADATVELARIAVDDGQEVLGTGLGIEVVDGRIDLSPLLQARDLLAALPIDRLVTARDDLAAPRDAWVPDLVLRGRTDTLELADEALDVLVTAEGLTRALPSFLGADGPRRYFVGFQTSAELRGTGGLIGYWGVMAVDDGQAVFGQSEVYEPATGLERPTGEGGVARIGSIGLSPENPPDADQSFLKRYQLFHAARYFSNVNLDPDLPTTSKAILDLFELQTGQALDGVVLVDPPGLQAMLESTGSTLPLDDDLALVIGYPDGLPTDRFARFVTAEIYEIFGIGRATERNDALTRIGDSAFQQVFDGGWDSTQMLRAVADGSTQRSLQVYVTDEEVQQAFHQVGATGTLDVPTDTDQFAITANNAVGGKQDVHLGHEFQLDVRLSNPGRTDDGELVVRRDASLEVTVDNPLPTEGMDPYVIGNCHVPDAPNRCFDGDPGVNRTWFTLWTSPDTFVMDFDSDEGAIPWGVDNTFRGLGVLDFFHVTPSESRASFSYDLAGVVPLLQGPEAFVYELSWWHQSKAIPDLLDVRVQPPDGWVISDVEVVGGGDGRGFGVHGDGVELRAEVTDGVAHLTGTVTADTRLRVSLAADD